MKPVTRVIRPETILLFLWGAELIRLAWVLPVLQTVAAWMVAFYVVLSLRSLRSSTVVFCLPLRLFSAGMATYMDQWNAVLRGFQNAAVFMAFFWFHSSPACDCGPTSRNNSDADRVRGT
ncbi:MAG: hypothetical protein VYA17_14330 [Pseudomonadota bacterium]|nr:hypothetical protein [Pseudomonadota bacterium]